MAGTPLDFSEDLRAEENMICATTTLPAQAASLADTLASRHDFWEYWGFEPWQSGPFVGVSRKQRFVKDGILGPVAEYKAWEAIVWAPGTAEEREALWRRCAPLPETMTQRFLFLLDEPWTTRRIRSFALGFRGFLEFYAYWPAASVHPKARDLAGLIDLALTIEQRTMAS